MWCVDRVALWSLLLQGCRRTPKRAQAYVSLLDVLDNLWRSVRIDKQHIPVVVSTVSTGSRRDGLNHRVASTDFRPLKNRLVAAGDSLVLPLEKG